MRWPWLRRLALGSVVLLVVAGAWSAWSRYAAPTRVAVVNYPGFQASRILKSQPSGVRAEVLPLERLDRIGRYDVALLIGLAAAVTGLVLSYRVDLPSGPSIVLCAGLAYLLSVLASTMRTRNGRDHE